MQLKNWKRNPMTTDDPDNYKILKSITKYKGKVLDLRLDKVKFPNDMVFEREVVEHGGAVGIVPLCKDKRIILVRQYRHPIRDTLLEIPAGTIDPDETVEDCAFRELREETGATAAALHKLGEFYTTPGYSSEMLHLFLAMVENESEPEPEDDELLEVVRVSLDQVLEMVTEAKIRDGKTIIGLCLASRYLQS
jgi:ADP-ribose pyrophosphatase